MTLTFVDAGVLIAAARGNHAASPAALAILSDPNRLFVASHFLQLEVLPKPTYFGQAAEVAFYQTYFGVVHVWVLSSPALVRLALQLASQHGIAAMDALHVAAAQIVKADEFVTTEQPTKPMFRAPSPRIISIHP